MSYSAFVSCNCYQQGKTSKPPYEEYLKIGEEGIYLGLPEELWKNDETLCYKMDKEFDKWKDSACEHKKMELADERLSNMSGMAAFRNIVQELGGKNKFPILTEYLPKANGGTLPTAYAEKALKELEALENDPTTKELVVLKEVTTGDGIASVNANTHLIFVFTGLNKYNYKINKDGFFILENVKENRKDVSYTMFRSKHFKQRTISKNLYKFTDIPTEDSFDCSVKLYPEEDEANSDFEFVVEIVKNSIGCEYEYMIAPLKTLAAASIQTGNPIVWT